MRLTASRIRRCSAVSAAALLAFPAAGWAARRVTLLPATAAPGSGVTLRGAGFPRLSRVTVSAAGLRTRRVATTRRGAFAARLVAPRREGWLRLVVRHGHRRIVSRLHVTRTGGAGGVVELASGRGARVRVAHTHVRAGGNVSVRARGYRPRERLLLAAFGRREHVRAGRRGRLSAVLAVPATLRPGVWSLRLTGGRVRFRVRVHVRVRTTAPPAPPPSRPANASAPQIAGAARAGQTLTARVGIWTGTSPIEYAFTWQRCGAAGSGCTNIYAATGSSYTVVDHDRGARLRVVVTASNALGAAVAASPLTAVVAATPGVSKSPTLPGSVRQGETVRVTSATFTGSAPRTVVTQWLRCGDTCVAVGAAKTSYVPVAADVGFRLQVLQTATSADGMIQVASNKTDPVLPAETATGVVARWAMNDLGSTMVDSAGDHDGSLHSVSTGLPGYSGTAFGFNGATSYVTVPAAGDLSAIDNDVALTIRMKTTQLPPTTVEDWDVIRSAGGYYDGDEYKMEYAPDGTAHCSFKGSGGYKEVVSSPAKPLDDGAWHTIECIKSETTVETVVDGAVSSARATIGTITITKGMILGAHSNAAGNGSSEFYDGALDEATLTFSAPG